ncbi:MAG: endopeptidase La [Candidatus Schekmanbacteria bacterium RIFCSPHIGHO2_02_FULL_38_11]|uniref:Lon protease n=1 Tax=Candidatus Schekmanbacteria bacterium RIFCSPLOWO2_12_FULL_38_15 TaxID=1817883 RepID=A0A1F7SJC4_9BACT|nr:MAG: endopeptidase La [Candidatus Schekmanbacteria bacterium GWA2_38_9]OGL50902.1 MAG: endopeptidase La [Candidatus Schekmanbacteria bacterium RIFCSPLOWO2_02_FULL_38_14]OGL53338.1 MAG: endopeptidase La [Candidatus Schekmanbacteria bacterium RIFCSPLOWO2_12_FULL_38_15]OGL54777.1 MAG: endopeptidase La [Candidatus Schekmanbacteria bacterium RIFCSPHIGHO2_02_FULL_38_11]
MIFKKEKKPSDNSIYPLIPLRDLVFFPHMIIPLFVGRKRSVSALDNAMMDKKFVIFAAQKQANINEPMEDDIFRVGTKGEILQVLKLSDGTVKILIEGLGRVKINEFIPNDSHLLVKAEEIIDEVDYSYELEALIRRVNSLFEEYVRLRKQISSDALVSVISIDDPSRLSDTIISHLALKVSDKQELLEIKNVTSRMEKLHELLHKEIEILMAEKKFQGKMKNHTRKSQREYLLNEQMRTVKNELAQQDDSKSEIEELREKIKAAKMPKDIEDKTMKELKKLEMMPPMSAEGTVVRNYIDWLVSLPWSKRTKDKLNLERAEQILNKDHYGLEKIKERVVEFLAVRRLVKKIKGPILCFVGPPGVGKTSLAKSIARAMGRNFVRVSLGGIRDEAEIRGHRRTYIGALPGKIIQSMKRAQSKNPVFLLDEVDKMSMDFRGDPSAALLEVLDPEQNFTFADHYLDVDFDLSQVMFITTANVLCSIPQPLQDRMEIIRIPGYTEEEKLNIGIKFLLPKQFKAHGITTSNLGMEENTILYIIRGYTKEAGVRNLEREIASICRKVARMVVKEGKKIKVIVKSEDVADYLGIPKYRFGKKETELLIGQTTGLAWTEFGGELLITEATIMGGKGNLTLTGKLGDVMQESAQAALSYLRSRSKMLGLEKDFFSKVDIHIHVPEGAIPKDGPSAGIAMATALASALTRIPVKNDVAMTGEITLRGRVLPIGGLKEKVLAAHRGGIKIIVCPIENEKDMKDIPDKIKGDLEFVFVENMDEVVKIALTRELPGQAELDSIVGDKDFSSAFENKETASEAIKH